VVIDGTEVQALALRALDAAKSAGATYADVRLTRQLRQSLKHDWAFHPGGRRTSGYVRLDGEHERLAVGIRVRVGNAWGFAASPYWETDDVVRLAGEAVIQAKANTADSSSALEWAPIPVASGHWATPIKADPFVVPLEEKADQLGAWMDLAEGYNRTIIGALAEADFTREEWALATSEGSYVTQTLYTSEGKYSITRTNLRGPQVLGDANALGLERTMAGWEIFPEADIPGQLPRLWEEADPIKPGVGFTFGGQRPSARGGKPGDIGRYTVVFDAASLSALLQQTLGPATQLDRALGLEANAGGTSYLGTDPLALLGTLQAASQLVTVTANRSLPRGMATVKWDDEGVEPQAFPLVKDGVLVDFQTTREQATWLAPYYQKQGLPARSHGCAGADSALGVTLQQMPNLVLEPGKANASFEDLVAGVKKGLAVTGASVDTDFQGRTGLGQGSIQEISNGKLERTLTGLVFSFNAPQLWKNVIALGGLESALQSAARATKGEPAQTTAYSVRTVPAVVKDVDFIRKGRRA
jgi:TldD protein